MNKKNTKDQADTKDIRRYVEFFNPFMEIVKEHAGAIKLSQVPPLMVEKLRMEKKEQREKFAGGGLKLHNRIAWVRKIMETAGLLITAEGNIIKLTEKGLKTKLGEDQDVYDMLSWCSAELDRKKRNKDAVLVKQFIKYLLVYGFGVDEGDQERRKA
jgi:restriction endonuclease Mrr